MTHLNIPVGISDFAEIRQNGYYYVDKTGLIAEVLKAQAVKVTLITRPRRFGKTLGMSTLENFFSIRKDSAVLFQGLGIMNAKDLLASREVENIFENSDFVLMLNQAAGDRAILAKQLNISPQQMKYVTHTEAGEGLIFYGNVVLPFVDRFPKDTELYRVMTTKPEEVGEA